MSDHNLNESWIENIVNTIKTRKSSAGSSEISFSRIVWLFPKFMRRIAAARIFNDFDISALFQNSTLENPITVKELYEVKSTKQESAEQ